MKGEMQMKELRNQSRSGSMDANHYHYCGLPWIVLPIGAFPLYWDAPFLAVELPDNPGDEPFIYWSREDGARHVSCADTSSASNEDYPCSDRGYEDQCAAACGFDSLDGRSW
jgi:hypothetical protein